MKAKILSVLTIIIVLSRLNLANRSICHALGTKISVSVGCNIMRLKKGYNRCLGHERPCESHLGN